MVRTSAPARRKGPKAAARGAQGRGPGAPAAVREFPRGSSPILVRATPGCIHCCGRCETHPCRLKGQL